MPLIPVNVHKKVSFSSCLQQLFCIGCVLCNAFHKNAGVSMHSTLQYEIFNDNIILLNYLLFVDPIVEGYCKIADQF